MLQEIYDEILYQKRNEPNLNNKHNIRYTFENYHWPSDNDQFFISYYKDYENCPFVIKLRKKYQKQIKRNINYDYKEDFLEYNEYEIFNFYDQKKDFQTEVSPTAKIFFKESTTEIYHYTFILYFL